MCLFSSRPRWEEDVVFANRPAKRHSHSHSRTRVTETIIRSERERSPRHSAQYIQAPLPPARISTPIIRPVTPPFQAPTPPPAPIPAPVRLELVSVEESHGSSRAGSSKAGKRRSKRGSEVYIERERVRERMTPQPERDEYETFRYVEGAGKVVGGEDGRRRSRSITYETNPRVSGRLVERERVVVEDGGRRREYYRNAD